MLFGYIVHITALLFGDEEDRAEWWEDEPTNATETETVADVDEKRRPREIEREFER